MNSSNSFNICPHCGNSNTLNARFCSRCGTQLKVPEEVVVCRSCGTRNSPMANFCRNCGTQLKVGEQTKICPSCRKEVPANQNVCTCGYSFATISTVQPDNGKPVALRGSTPPVVEGGKGKKDKKSKKAKTPKHYPESYKGGRGIAITALIFLLLFAYLVFAPFQITKVDEGGSSSVIATLRPAFLANLDGGIVRSDGGAWYGFEFIVVAIGIVVGAIQGQNFMELATSSFGNLLMIILATLAIITALVMIIHFIVVFVRIFTKKRSKRSNGFFLIMAILSTLVVAPTVVFSFIDAPAGFLQTIESFFTLPEGWSFGWIMVAIPLYYWFFFIYSACAKLKPIKEHAV